jgi:hypothetical protein
MGSSTQTHHQQHEQRGPGLRSACAYLRGNCYELPANILEGITLVRLSLAEGHALRYTLQLARCSQQLLARAAAFVPAQTIGAIALPAAAGAQCCSCHLWGTSRRRAAAASTHAHAAAQAG